MLKIVCFTLPNTFFFHAQVWLIIQWKLFKFVNLHYGLTFDKKSLVNCTRLLIFRDSSTSNLFSAEFLISFHLKNLYLT